MPSDVTPPSHLHGLPIPGGVHEDRVQLSTHALTTQNAHQVGVLVTLSGEAPRRRSPINVALVLDRSGSMSGEPLRAAKEAALRFAGFLGDEDRLTVVSFADQVETDFGPASPTALPPDRPTALAPTAAIQSIVSGGSTNLSGGWLMGQRQVRAGLVDGTNRVVLLTDGQANVGVVDPTQLAGLAADSAAQRVSTTCIGFGPGFNEDLLAAMAKAGRQRPPLHQLHLATSGTWSAPTRWRGSSARRSRGW
jgi:Ca-activated chloride channel family protein